MLYQYQMPLQEEHSNFLISWSIQEKRLKKGYPTMSFGDSQPTCAADSANFHSSWLYHSHCLACYLLAHTMAGFTESCPKTQGRNLAPVGAILFQF